MRPGVFMLVFAIALAVFVASLALFVFAGHAARCTHGVSSIGPVQIKDGKLSGSTKPHTEACLR